MDCRRNVQDYDLVTCVMKLLHNALAADPLFLLQLSVLDLHDTDSEVGTHLNSDTRVTIFQSSGYD